MYDFDLLAGNAKIDLHKELIKYVEIFGGTNFFLSFLEELREQNPHPLKSENCCFHNKSVSIKWNKVIFENKITLLSKIRTIKGYQLNILPSCNTSSYKNISNLIRTFHPIEFTVKLKKPDGLSFGITAFNEIDKNTIVINPVFDAIFFYRVSSVKKALNYTSA